MKAHKNSKARESEKRRESSERAKADGTRESRRKRAKSGVNARKPTKTRECGRKRAKTLKRNPRRVKTLAPEMDDRACIEGGETKAGPDTVSKEGPESGDVNMPTGFRVFQERCRFKIAMTELFKDIYDENKNISYTWVREYHWDGSVVNKLKSSYVFTISFSPTLSGLLRCTSSLEVKVEAVRTEYGHARLECIAADERAKLLAYEVTGSEEKALSLVS
nr:protein BLISTER isoform X1 [Tanacetum cinerariifolium]